MESKELKQHVEAFMLAHPFHPTTMQVCVTFCEMLDSFQQYEPHQKEFIIALRAAFLAKNIPQTKIALDEDSFLICVGNIPIFFDDIKTVQETITTFNEVAEQFPNMKEPIYFINPDIASVFIDIKSKKQDRVSAAIKQFTEYGNAHFRIVPSGTPNVTTLQMTMRLRCSANEADYYAMANICAQAIHHETKTRIRLSKADRPYHLIDEPKEKHTELCRLYGNGFEYAGHGKIQYLPTYPQQTTYLAHIGIASDEKEGQHLVTILDREMPVVAQEYCTVSITETSELKKFTKQLRQRIEEMKLPLDPCRHQCVLNSEQLVEIQKFIKSMKHQDCYTNDPHNTLDYECNHDDPSSDSDC